MTKEKENKLKWMKRNRLFAGQPVSKRRNGTKAQTKLQNRLCKNSSPVDVAFQGDVRELVGEAVNEWSSSCNIYQKIWQELSAGVGAASEDLFIA